MNRSLRIGLVSALAALALVAVTQDASALTRDEVLSRAKGFAYHPWRSGAANQRGTCATENASYVSLSTPGDYVGIPYDWGGYMSLYTFDQGIAQGLGAGSQASDGILECAVGLDCSGFVSQSWGVGHFTTSDLASTSAQITQAQMLPGDVYNKAGYHVAMYSHSLASGEPVFYEAIGYNVHINATEGFAHVQGYLPRRANNITGTTATDPVGSLVNPIPIPSFPFTDSRDTRQSQSKMLDGCLSDPTKPQKGPEYVYKVVLTQPGTLTVSVSDDAATDVDVQLLGALDTNACLARNDSTFTQQVGCGTYYVVADTYGTDSSKAGPYTLSASFTPSGAACSAVPGPAPYNPKGKLGDACKFPKNQTLPYCNPNLGGDTCIYTSTDSFCSKPCATDNDCADMPGAKGCCKDLGQGEKYCLTAAVCGSGSTPGKDDGGAVGDPSTPSTPTDPNNPSNPSNPSNPANPADPGATPGEVTTTTTTSGCSSTPVTTTGSTTGIVFGLAGLGVAMWRRRRRGRPSLPPIALG
jgi:MYXO-CTERM domain-containing protein